MAAPETAAGSPQDGSHILEQSPIFGSAVTRHPVDKLNLVTRPRPLPAAAAHVPLQLQGEEAQSVLLPTTAHLLRALHDDSFQVYPDDVWLVTYTKTGTTWMTEILQHLICRCDERMIEQYKAEMLPWIRLAIFAGEGEQLRRRLEMIRNLSRPRLIVTHLPGHELPDKIFNTCKVVITIRNPKDTAVSLYHFHRMSAQAGNYTGDWETFLRAYIGGHTFWGSWVDWHIPTFVKHENSKQHVLFVYYEELKKEPEKIIKAVSNFLEMPASEDIVRKTAANSDFDYMKKVVGPFMDKIDFLDSSISPFFRKGIVGDWKTHFTVAQSELYDAVLEKATASAPRLKLIYQI